MPVTLNLKLGIDLPVFQWLKPLPLAAAAGASLVNDKRGTNRFIYVLLSIASFWRYDTYTDAWQQLANPPAGLFAAGISMTLDPSKGTLGYVWLFTPLAASPYATFAYYDIAVNTWTARNAPTGLAAQWGTDASLSHTCSTYNVAGDDNAIYLIGNNSTAWYKFSISGNAWSTMAPVLPAAAGAGCSLVWVFNYNVDKIYYLRSTATTALYVFTISTPAWSADTVYNPKTETFTTGTAVCYDNDKRIYIQKDATHRVYYYQLDEDRMYPAGTIPYTSGTAMVGDGFVFLQTPDGAKYIYYRRQTGTEFWRMLIGWF